MRGRIILTKYILTTNILFINSNNYAKKSSLKKKIKLNQN